MKQSTKYLKIIVNILSMAATVAFFVWVLPKILVYFMPFVIAGIIAMIANPLVRFLEQKLKIVRKAGTVVVIVLVLGVVVFLVYAIVAKLMTEAVGLVSNAPKIWSSISATTDSVVADLNTYFSRMPAGARNWLENVGNDLSVRMTQWVSELGTPVAEIATNAAKNLPLIIVGVIMGVLASYLFLAEKDYVLKLIRTFIPEGIRNRSEMILSTMKKAVGGYFVAQFKIMMVVYVVLLIGLIILGVEYAALIALLIAFLDFLPFFGTGAVMWPWALVAFLQSDYKMAIGMMIVWAISQLVRQLIQPKLVGESVGLKPIPTLFFLYIGFRVGGALGLILSIPIGMIVINFYKAGGFSNFVYSIKLLIKDIGRIRKFDKEDLIAEGIIPDESDREEEDVHD